MKRITSLLSRLLHSFRNYYSRKKFFDRKNKRYNDLFLYFQYNVMINLILSNLIWNNYRLR